jgi:3-oxocholest-4-en-26-oate---CoA ligase
LLVHLSPIQELIAAAIPDREALLWRDRRFTYAELNARCRRFARVLRRLGLGCRVERSHLDPWQSGQDHVALYLYNCNEYLEALMGAFQARAVGVNVNYRYVADELQYLLNDSGARAIVYHLGFAPTLREVLPRLPQLRTLIHVADESGEAPLAGSLDYEELLAAESADPLDLPYCADDLYILYTGGTTGMPKGVLWRQEDVFFNGLGGHVPGFPKLDTEQKILDHIQLGIGGRFLIAMPFMHGAGHWSALNSWHRGGTAVLPDENRRLDAHSFWRAVEQHRADQIGVIGDAFAQPLIRALHEQSYDVSSVRLVMSTAAVFSPSVKQELLSLLPEGTMVVESIGGSEMGLQAMSMTMGSGESGLPTFELRPGTVLLDADRRALLTSKSSEIGELGEIGEIGWIASSGHLPLGYLEDPDKTRRTFPTIDGTRYVVGGDRARYDENGRLVFLGRESVCINTGGEKVYVEEVERVVKSHRAVLDALVVGVPSERYGAEVTAVISLKPGETAPSAAELRAHCAPHLAGYKIPRTIVVAPEVARSPSGKPDYAWAKSFAVTALRSSVCSPTATPS